MLTIYQIKFTAQVVTKLQKTFHYMKREGGGAEYDI